VAAQKLARIEQKLSVLATMRDALGKYDKQLKSGTCSTIEILQRDSEFQPAANRSSDHRKRKSTRHLRPLLGESPVASLLERSEGRLGDQVMRKAPALPGLANPVLDISQTGSDGKQSCKCGYVKLVDLPYAQQ